MKRKILAKRRLNCVQLSTSNEISKNPNNNRSEEQAQKIDSAIFDCVTAMSTPAMNGAPQNQILPVAGEQQTKNVNSNNNGTNAVHQTIDLNSETKTYFRTIPGSTKRPNWPAKYQTDRNF